MQGRNGWFPCEAGGTTISCGGTTKPVFAIVPAVYVTEVTAPPIHVFSVAPPVVVAMIVAVAVVSPVVVTPPWIWTNDPA